VAKDRAAPFSRKHRRYWIPVTGGMILIGLVNVAIGLCSYSAPPPPQPIVVQPNGGSDRDLGRIPTPVMKAFTTRYPRTLPSAVEVKGDGSYVLSFGSASRATFRADGTFVGER
jgi:hypothetical protein